MPDSSSLDPAHDLLGEALTHLDAHGVDVWLNKADGAWRYVVEGVAVSSGEGIAKTVALGMLKTGLGQ